MFQPLSAAMHRRAMVQWGSFALISFLLGIVLIGAGTVLRDQNVTSELEYQKISLGPFSEMNDAEKAIPGMEDCAGGPVTTGKCAKVYSEYIKVHMQESAVEAGFSADDTYATLGGPRREAAAALEDAKASGDEAKIEAAQAKYDEVSALRDSMLTGSTLRGQLLNAYAWDTVIQVVIYVGIGFLVFALFYVGLLLYERKIGHLPATANQQPMTRLPN